MKRYDRSRSYPFALVTLTLGFLMALIMFGPTPARTAPAENLLIGSISELSGPGSTIGIPWARAVEMVCETFNKKGGISVGGKKYNLVTKSYDDRGSADGGVSAANALIFRDKAKYIVGPISSSAAVAIRDTISEPNKVLLLSNSWAVKLGTQWPLTFRTTPTTAEIYPEAFKWFHQQYPQAKVWGEIELDNASGHYSADSSALALKGVEGVSLAQPEFCDPSATDFFAILNKLIMGQKIDLLWSISLRPGQASLIVKQARELGFKGPILVWVDEKAFREGVSLEYLAGVYGMHAFDFDSKLASAKQKQIAREYQAKYGEKMNFYAELAYDSATALILAIEKAGSLDPDRVKDVLADLKWEGLSGKTYNFSGEKTWGIKRQISRDYYLMVFEKGGKWTVASTVFAVCP